MTQPTPLHPSVRATYDSAETGPRYHVSSRVAGRVVTWREPLADPFVRHIVRLSWRTLLRGLLVALVRRRHLEVEILVGGDVEVMYDVLELDDQALVAGRTRHAAFHQSMHGKLAAFAAEEDRRG